ncbi:ATP-binding protein [Azospirillum brasilense]|uniref:ATP-binding protein n=2 Tax=Azospirillum brasilense TaxID=192 RepID=A0A6L3ASG9_AZOBR|nr:ATP-binding protein [Azospirillum brasilense]
MQLTIVDGQTLRAYLADAGLSWPTDIPYYGPVRTLLDGIAYDRYVEPSGDPEIANIFLSLYNRTNMPRSVELCVQTDSRWSVVEGDRLDRVSVDVASFLAAQPIGVRPEVIAPFSSRSFRFCARLIVRRAQGSQEPRTDRRDRPHDLLKAIATLGLQCASGRQIRRVLYRSKTSAQIIYRSPFIGKGHIKARDQVLECMSSAAEKEAGRTIVLIGGEAGVGKSRIISEAMEKYRGDALLFCRCTVATGGTVAGAAVETLRSQLSNLYSAGMEPHWLTRATCLEHILLCLEAEPADASYRLSYLTPVLIVEDMHNASRRLCRLLLRIALKKACADSRYVLLLAGRNDDSFANASYLEMETILASTGATVCRVEALKDHEPGELVRTLIEGIDETATARILALSGTTPNAIIQCMEYLLDATLISIASSGTLSITHPPSFLARLQELPTSMKRLYAKRFQLLGHWIHGREAQEALLAATFFGTNPPAEVCGPSTSPQAAAVREELKRRRLLAEPPMASRESAPATGPALAWSHESILLFFSNLLRDTIQEVPASSSEIAAILARFPATARRLRHDRPLFDALPPLVQGAVAVLADDRETAYQRFAPMLDAVRRIESFSTITIPTDYYDAIDYAIRLVRTGSDPVPRLLSRLIPAKAYIGAFHKALPYALLADRFGKRLLDGNCLTGPEGEWCRFWLDTLTAHVLMDAGQSGEALRRYHELQILVRVLPDIRSDPRLSFEIHNALRLLHTYTNFRNLAELHGRLAEEAALACDAEAIGTSAGRAEAERGRAQELFGMGLGDEALRFFLPNPDHCLELNRMGFRASCKGRTERHKRHGIASLIACKLKARGLGGAGRNAGDHRKWLRCQATVIARLVEQCRNARYRSILPRLHLLQATIAYLQGVAAEAPGTTNANATAFFDAAQAFSDDGKASCIDNAIGYIHWQLHNLDAVIAKRRGEDTQAVKSLRSAVDSMMGEGLGFMGDDAVISPGPVILANVIKAQLEVDARIRETLGRLRGFHPYCWNRDEDFLEIQKHAERYHHIIRGVPGKPPGLIIDKPTKLAVVCWF